MRDFTYTVKQVELIRHLLGKVPHKIYWNYVSFVFDYSEYFIELRCEDRAAISQNNGDEAIISVIELINVPYIRNDQYDKLVCENRSIDGAYILRSLLYFTDHYSFSEDEQLHRQADALLNEAITGNEDKLARIVSKTTGSHKEIICSPDSEMALEANSEYSNLIDSGLLLRMGEEYLPAYVVSNFYGFVTTMDDKYFFNLDELKDYFDDVTLIDIP